jgi:hypothetical protein
MELCKEFTGNECAGGNGRPAVMEKHWQVIKIVINPDHPTEVALV